MFGIAVKSTVDHNDAMSRDDPPMRIRLPEALKASVQSRAADNRRSMNAEIIRRLEWSIAAESDFAAFEDQSDARSKEAARHLLRMSASGDDAIEKRFAALEAEVAALKVKVGN